MNISCSRCGSDHEFRYCAGNVLNAVYNLGWGSYGAALYCPECTATWDERNKGRPQPGLENTIGLISTSGTGRVKGGTGHKDACVLPVGLCEARGGTIEVAYNVYCSCDKCGVTYSWINHSVSFSMAKSIAREAGWKIGKRGWYCPECRRSKKEDNESNHNPG